MRLFIRNTLIALVGVAVLMLLFWYFGRVFDWVAFRTFHVPAKSQSFLLRELRSLCEIGLGGLIAWMALKLKAKLPPIPDIEAPEHYSVAEPLAFGVVVFAMMLIGAFLIVKFH